MKGERFVTLLSLAVSARAQFDSLDPCGQTCVSNTNNLAGQFGCAAMDFSCLCGVADWGNSIRDCAEGACPPGYAPTVVSAASAVCATATLPPGAPNPTSQTSTSSETPSPTAKGSTESTEESSSTTKTSSTKSESSATSTTSTTMTSSTTSATPTAEPTKTVSSSTTASSTPAASTSEAAKGSASTGISEAGKIGIGIGVAAVVIGLAAVAACFMLRKRQATQPPKFKISHPMPSNEYAYTNNNHSDNDIGSSELEMKSRRYEDMLPRTEPRQMV
ncbi:hypothetical protein L209DRAFT_683890 [Thermothelomyces heterothallicus CBS 203.75]